MNTNITTYNLNYIKKFHDEIITQGLSKRRQQWYLQKIKKLLTGVKTHIDEITKEELKDIIREKVELTDYKEWTKVGYKLTLRQFIKFTEGIEWNDNQYPEKVKWIQIKTPKNQLRREDLLTIEDIRTMVDYCDNVQDKAIISSLFEGGFRAGEAEGMTLASVKSSKHGCTISVKGKTGVRVVPLIYSAPYIIEWLQMHPGKADTNSPLWISKSTNYCNRPLGQAGLSKKIRTIAHKVGIKNKKLNLHSIRHASATHMARYLSESIMKKYYGWTQASTMAATYVHLNAKDVSQEILKLHGLTEIKDDKGITIKQCPRCSLIINNISKYCPKCGLCLDEEEAQKFITVNHEVVPRSIIEELKEEIKKELLNEMEVKK